MVLTLEVKVDGLVGLSTCDAALHCRVR